MKFIYLLGVKLYGLAILIASLWNQKAAQFIKGRQGVFTRISAEVPEGQKLIWVHCSSLGEYEQGKPLILRLKESFVDHKIFLTLFSPSGYENLVGKSVADYMYYLPIDGPKNAERLLRWINPSMAFFIKYDFWYFYLDALKKRNIPSYVVSAIFRPHMRYFKWYGGFFKNLLRMFEHLFVQDLVSQTCLYDNNITDVSVSGDTRFDTVWSNWKNRQENALAKDFSKDSSVIVGGSTWPADESLLFPLLNESDLQLKLIIAPHELSEARLMQIEKDCPVPSIRYSQTSVGAIPDNIRVLIIDNIGMLSGLYEYGSIAFIGGGFGKGIHNTLEAAVFGCPVIFGPKYKSFQEAQKLLKIGGGFSIKNYDELLTITKMLLKEEQLIREVRDRNKLYIDRNKGASDIVIDYLTVNQEARKKAAI